MSSLTLFTAAQPMALSFQIQGRPESKPSVAFRGRQRYNPKRAKMLATRDTVSNLVSSLPGGDGPVFVRSKYLYVDLVFHFPRPRSHLRRNSNRLVVLRDGLLQSLKSLIPSTKVDLDNLAKFILDAMTGPVYEDDSQIVKLSITKLFDNESNCEGRTEVKVIEIHTVAQLTSFV